MSRKQISPGGFVSMMALTLEATPISIGFAPVIHRAHEDAWMAPLLAIALMLLVMYPLFRLFARLGESLFNDERPLSVWVSLLVAPLCLMLLYWLVFNTRVFGDLIRTAYLTETPAWVVYSGFMVVCAFASFHGIEVLARVAILIMGIKVITLGLVPIFVLEDVDLQNFLPLMAHGPLPVVWATLEPFSWFAEGALLAFLFPLVKNGRFRHVVYGFLVMMESYYVLFVGSILVFSAPLAARMVYPALMLVQMMAIGDFFDRIDPILVAVWAFAMFIKGAVYLMILSELLSRLFRVHLRRRLSWGLALLVVFFADSVVRSVAHMVQLYKEYWLLPSLFVLLDLYLLAWVLLRRNPGKDKSESWNATDVSEGRSTDGST